MPTLNSNSRMQAAASSFGILQQNLRAEFQSRFNVQSEDDAGRVLQDPHLGPQAAHYINEANQVLAHHAHEAQRQQAALKEANQHWSQFQDVEFERRVAKEHPELKGEARDKATQRAVELLRTEGLSDEQIANLWHGGGTVPFRHAAMQSVLLKAVLSIRQERRCELQPNGQRLRFSVPVLQAPVPRSSMPRYARRCRVQAQSISTQRGATSRCQREGSKSMTNGGWLGDCKVSGEPQTEPVTDAESAELYRLIEAGAKAERDQQWQAYNADQDKFLRLRLWQKYEEHIDALDNLASGTLKKYQRVFGEFAENCAEANLTALPAAVGTVATYLDHKLSAGASPETIRCVAAAICVCSRSI